MSQRWQVVVLSVGPLTVITVFACEGANGLGQGVLLRRVVAKGIAANFVSASLVGHLEDLAGARQARHLVSDLALVSTTQCLRAQVLCVLVEGPEAPGGAMTKRNSNDAGHANGVGLLAYLGDEVGGRFGTERRIRVGANNEVELPHVGASNVLAEGREKLGGKDGLLGRSSAVVGVEETAESDERVTLAAVDVLVDDQVRKPLVLAPLAGDGDLDSSPRPVGRLKALLTGDGAVFAGREEILEQHVGGGH